MAAFGMTLAVIGGVVAAFSGATAGNWVAVGVGAGIAGLALLIWDRGEDGGRPG
jgi:hypothetical protein